MTNLKKTWNNLSTKYKWAIGISVVLIVASIVGLIVCTGSEDDTAENTIYNWCAGVLITFGASGLIIVIGNYGLSRGKDVGDSKAENTVGNDKIGPE